MHQVRRKHKLFSWCLHEDTPTQRKMGNISHKTTSAAASAEGEIHYGTQPQPSNSTVKLVIYTIYTAF